MVSEKYTWIQTRDGSPTLWHNGLGESYRSFRGAYTESWAAFVEPALTWVASAAELPQVMQVGEFGLGAGTNWVLWNLAAKARGIESGYFAIEADPAAFALGIVRWRQEAETLAVFLRSRGIEVGPAEVSELLATLPPPQIFASIALAQEARGTGELDPAQLWFHDPFGYEVNPDGYRRAALVLCETLWDERTMWGGSYACNRHFRESLASLPRMEARVVPMGAAGIKQERLEFRRSEPSQF